MVKKATKKTAFTNIMHIGMVVRDMDKTIERMTALGIGPFTPRILPPDAKETYRGKPFIPSKRVKIYITKIGNMELELIQPINGKSPHQEFLEQKGEGIQHIGVLVDDVEEVLEDLKAKDSTELLRSHFKGGGGVAYLDLDAAGLIVEFVQAPKR